MKNMLKIDSLTASYDTASVLNGLSIHVDKGEMIALIGANGAGKSTLLNCISGFVKKTQGSVQFDGQELRGRSPHDISRMGLLHVPEGRQVVQDLSTLDNLLLGMSALSGRKPQHTLEDVFGLFPILQERRNQIAGTLSGGQQQMLAIGRALMGSPRLLMLDEPSLGLAPLIVSQVFTALKALKSQGMTILLVEQNARLALQASDRAYVLERGSISRHGPARDLANDPAVISSYLGH